MAGRTSSVGNATGPLLEYVGTGNHEPLLVGVDNEGKFADGCPFQRIGGIVHDHILLEGGALSAWTQNAISTDGETVFFSDVCERQLFARIGNGTPGAHTVAVSEPSAADCSVCAAEGLTGEAEFDGASEDGSRVFFTRTSSSGSNLYEYDFNGAAGQRVVRVTTGDGTVSVPAPELRGVVQVSPDGSHVYFVAGGVLTSARNYAGLSAQPGGDNLYLYERDARYPGGRTVFVATLSPRDEQLLWHEDKWSNITPDGRFLVLVSRTVLTADDASSAGQVFEYDSQSNTMVRVSIGQNGYNDDGNIHEAREEPRILSPSYTPEPYLPMKYSDRLTMSGDGSYVFFESPVALVPGALNLVPEVGDSTALAKNVYEYHDGSMYLISDGQDTGAVSLNGTDLSGRDVLISTADPLVAQAAGSTNVDVYDARIDGGISAPPAPEACEGDTCQGLLGAAPVLLSPGSEFQRGGENVAAPAPAPLHQQVKKKPGKPKKRARGRRRRKAGKSSGRAVRPGGRGAGRRS